MRYVGKKFPRQRKYQDANLNKHRKHPRRYYLSHKPHFRAKAKRKYADIQTYVTDIKSKPCTDCKKTFLPCVMDFDRVNPKVKVITISSIGRKGSWRILHEELAKCELVCSNCHRIRTFNRAHETRSSLTVLEAVPNAT